jgi:hypothetical protein
MTPRKLRETIELGGLVYDDGILGRKITSGLLAKPNLVELKCRCIHWKGPCTRIQPTRETFDRFVALWEKKDAGATLAFAQTWGTLKGYRGSEAREPLSEWRDLSRHASELLGIAALLRKTDKALEFDELSSLMSMSMERALSKKATATTVGARTYEMGTWKEYRAHWGKGPLIPYAKAVKVNPNDYDYPDNPELWRGHADGYLSEELAVWEARFGRVSFTFGLHPIGSNEDKAGPLHYEWKASLDFGGRLLCYLGFQLGLVLVGGDAPIFSTCDGCGRPYLRKRGRRKPNPGTRNYCDEDACKTRARNRIAAARAREKRKRSSPYI